MMRQLLKSHGRHSYFDLEDFIFEQACDTVEDWNSLSELLFKKDSRIRTIC